MWYFVVNILENGFRHLSWIRTNDSPNTGVILLLNYQVLHLY
mgnify:CR=1 FL=1